MKLFLGKIFGAVAGFVKAHTVISIVSAAAIVTAGVATPIAVTVAKNKDTNKDIGSNITVSESNTETNEQSKSDEFTKPKDYATVLQVKSGIELNLYIDEDGEVLAVEPLNKDAKSVANDLNISKKDYENVVSDIVTKANEKGFVKADTTINLSVTENKSENINADDILSKANTATTSAATKLGIELKVETLDSTKTPAETKPDTSSKPETQTSKPSESSKPEETDKKTETKPDTSSKPNDSSHTHSYSDATCTEAKKCSCGATDGKALGHKWTDATCKAPKTCTVCKATEGNIGDHKYTNGKCSYCNKTQIINPKTGLKEHADYYHVSEDDDGHYTLIIWQFYDSMFTTKDPCGVYTTNAEHYNEIETIFYKGKTYYSVDHGGPLPSYTTTDQEIILKYTDEELIDSPNYADEEFRLIVNHEYDLEVTYASGVMLKKGDVLDLVE